MLMVKREQWGFSVFEWQGRRCGRQVAAAVGCLPSIGFPSDPIQARRFRKHGVGLVSSPAPHAEVVKP